MPYADAREAPEWEAIAVRAEDYTPGTVPMGGLLLVCGVDVQRDRLEAEVVAFGRFGESWSVDYRVIHGDPHQPAVWRDLDALLNERFPHAGGGDLTVEKPAIDSGDGMTTQAVYAWAGKHGLRRVMAIKGTARTSQVLGTARPVETGADGKARKVGGVKVTLVGVSLLKARVYAHLRQAPGDAAGGAAGGDDAPFGVCHFPRYGDEYFQMLTAESLVKRQNRAGFATLEWVKTRPRNEALDCRVYAMAAALACGMERFTDAHWAARERLAGATGAAKAPRPDTLHNPQGVRTGVRPPSAEASSAVGIADVNPTPPSPPRTPPAPKKPAVIRSKWLTGG